MEHPILIIIPFDRIFPNAVQFLRNHKKEADSIQIFKSTVIPNRLCNETLWTMDEWVSSHWPIITAHNNLLRLLTKTVKVPASHICIICLVNSVVINDLVMDFPSPFHVMLLHHSLVRVEQRWQFLTPTCQLNLNPTCNLWCGLALFYLRFEFKLIYLISIFNKMVGFELNPFLLF